MPTREVTLRELWQTCRVCEDSCRRMADVLGAAVRQADTAVPPLRIAVAVDLPEGWPMPEPDPPCVPPWCQISHLALARKAELLAQRVTVLVQATRILRDQYPDRVIDFYTCVPGGPDISR
jgi:hypothetical protein